MVRSRGKGAITAGGGCRSGKGGDGLVTASGAETTAVLGTVAAGVTRMLTTFPHEECIESKARSSTYKSTALSSGKVDVKLRPKSMSTCVIQIQGIHLSPRDRRHIQMLRYTTKDQQHKAPEWEPQVA
ncbi:unnamed protein product [Fraxinus pennsylvanica]|uniref:Uncharacterized protein n=1 Tax=Fraxinus pennsylvanica TaxID=56036 RepID=A0AAD2A9J8_9LAMI|nr:unnamed protein product [Fraxinus pennsylvanica]